jgi:hypothetical protein
LQLVSVPGFVAVTAILIVALLPAPRSPIAQVTVPSWALGVLLVVRVQFPFVVDIELKRVLAGSGSVTFTLVAVWPPLFVATIV